jgi:23S rRNA pseudouridine955/2504/2580 synthase
MYEDSNLLILNKPPGIAVHGSASSACRASLDEQVQAYLAPKLPPSLSFRPGPLHRLDKPTSGVIAFSVSLEGARLFSALLRDGNIRKEYLAVVDGIVGGAIGDEEVWEDRLVRDPEMRKTMTEGEPGGEGRAQRALTRIRPLARTGSRTLIGAEIATGRTHQIRAQAAARGHPLSGDRKYGGKPFPAGGRTGPGAFFLHAGALEFLEAPPGMMLPRRVEAPPPVDFALVLRAIFRYTDFS